MVHDEDSDIAQEFGVFLTLCTDVGMLDNELVCELVLVCIHPHLTLYRMEPLHYM